MHVSGLCGKVISVFFVKVIVSDKDADVKSDSDIVINGTECTHA